MLHIVRVSETHVRRQNWKSHSTVLFWVLWHVKIIVFYNGTFGISLEIMQLVNQNFFIFIHSFILPNCTLSRLSVEELSGFVTSSGHTSHPTSCDSLRDNSRARHCPHA